MSISAVILSFNAKDDLDRCVHSLIEVENLEAGKDQILIVENGSVDGSKALVNRLSALYPGIVEGIDLRSNHGTTISRNIALSRATGEHILIIDADIEFRRPVIQPLLDELERDPAIGIIAPRLIFPNGRPQMSTDIFPTISRKVERMLRLRQIEQAAGDSERQMQSVDYAISAFWLMPRNMLETVGFLDERIFYAPEDVDFCLRTWLAGKKIVYQPAVEVVHDAKERSRSLKGILFTWRHLLGLAYFFRKHDYCWRAETIYQQISAAHGGVTDNGRPTVRQGQGWARG